MDTAKLRVLAMQMASQEAHYTPEDRLAAAKKYYLFMLNGEVPETGGKERPSTSK